MKSPESDPTTHPDVWGFNANGHQGPLEFVNNTAFGNPRGFDFFDRTDVAHFARNNISYGNTTNVFRLVQNVVDHAFNTWNPGFTAKAADFLSVSPIGMDGPRGPNEELPVVDFMRLAPGSSMIDAGLATGLSYQGSAPDLGAFESTPIPVPVLRVPGIRVAHTAAVNTAAGSTSTLTIRAFTVREGNALVVVVNSEGPANVNYTVTYQIASQSTRPLANNIVTTQANQGAGVF